jgi:TolA-binding protein
VQTELFTVTVLGTRFAVDAESVAVFEGAVRITDPRGDVLADTLRAGGRWQWVATATAAVEPAPVPNERGGPPSSVTAADRLGRAHAHLRNGRADRAAAAARQALQLDPTGPESAEAHTLLAEVALVRGNPAGAARAYRRVAERYPRLPAGENALFALASLESDLGRPQEARRLLRDYLERYPHGRFVAEVRRRLER